MTGTESKPIKPFVTTPIVGANLIALLEARRGDLIDFAVGFAKVAPEPDNALLAGSGTLVSVCGTHAILTAAHVIENLPKTGPLGLILPNRLEGPSHKLVVQIQLTEKRVIARGTNDARGPDLGLLILLPADADKIKAAGKVFYNLSKRRERMRTKPPPLKTNEWLLLSGFVDEWTQNAAPERGFTWVKSFQGLFALAGLEGQRREGPFDYLSLKVDCDEAYKGPQSFKGCSGGGVWQAVLGKRDNRLEIHEMLLVGVAFYQAPENGNPKSIECHGRRSIYEVAVREINPVVCH